MERSAVWDGFDDWRAELAHIRLQPPVAARGTQIGRGYRADYELDAQPDCVTRSLLVETAGEGWARRLELSRDRDGGWDAQTWQGGDFALRRAGGDIESLTGALDCDLAFSPLTNLMPVLRHGLHLAPGRADLLVAWVSLPDLGVHAARQRYETVAVGERPVVRYSDPDFTAELTLDADGLVLIYPELARRVALSS